MKSLLSQLSILKNNQQSNQTVEKLLSPESIDRVTGGKPKSCNYTQTASDPVYDQTCTMD